MRRTMKGLSLVSVTITGLAALRIYPWQLWLAELDEGE